MTKIFVSSLTTGECPDGLRIANAVLLFKKGVGDNPGNYRLESLTSVVGVILEKIIWDGIYSHLGMDLLGTVCMALHMAGHVLLT